jgi:hypothetical protein
LLEGNEKNWNNKVAGILSVTRTSQKLNNKLFLPEENFLKSQYFWSCSVRGGFTFYSSFFILLPTEVTMRPLVVPKDCINSNPYWII